MTYRTRLGSVREELAQCPICTEIYDNGTRIPRRLPCCEQLTCESCLQVYSKDCRRIACPLCRNQITMSGGVKSLAKDLTVLRLLDVYSEIALMCTDCPDKKVALAKCSNCRVLLCQPCSDAHRRHSATRTHKITDLEQAQSSGTPQQNVAVKKNRIPNDVAVKLEIIKAKIANLADADENIRLSKRVAMDTINKSFDDLAAELQQRRTSLLTLVDSQAQKEEKSIMIVLESQRGLQNRIDQAIEDTSSIKDAKLSLESADDVQYVRRGISFIDTDVREIASVIKTAGRVRTVSYNPRERPPHLEASSPCTAVTFDYTQRDDDSVFDQVMTVGRKLILCPHLVYDESTASKDDLTIGPEISNFGPGQDLHDNGCRLRRKRSVFLSRPLRFTTLKRQMFLMKLQIKLKTNVPDRASVWGTHCTKSPDDMDSSQMKGFDLDIGTCPQHNSLCLRLVYDRTKHECNPIMTNGPGTSRDITVAVLLDSEDNSIKVFNISNTVPLGTVPGVDFSEPIWTMVTLGRPEWAEIKTEIIPARDVKLSTAMTTLLSSY